MVYAYPLIFLDIGVLGVSNANKAISKIINTTERKTDPNRTRMPSLFGNSWNEVYKRRLENK